MVTFPFKKKNFMIEKNNSTEFFINFPQNSVSCLLDPISKTPKLSPFKMDFFFFPDECTLGREN
ncbi:hypothetical protein BpHYR1_005323 [Brachionus plicatilis]|uniref:Uncharacterized protein n=1 Tax=Brachionus plicatilis TaxID=10195 RepID=A0A3M7QA68_BRAPC|nr:hypothetical protein BpHYR1_005323 [Brachionus plicatilis]